MRAPRFAVTFAPLLLCVALLFPPPDGRAASLSKNLPLSARDMEFYYQRKNPEVLPSMLRAFDRQGKFAHGEIRLMVGAFLATVLRENPKAASRVLPPESSMSHDGRRALAWMTHLAGLANEGELLASLLTGADAALHAQIRNSPNNLLKWDIYKEKSVLQMYWAAYFASGGNAFLDAIVGAALRYSRLNSAGRQHDAAFPVCAAAAASLYELAPRHADVRARLSQTLGRTSGAESETLRVILRQADAAD